MYSNVVLRQSVTELANGVQLAIELLLPLFRKVACTLLEPPCWLISGGRRFVVE